MKPILRSLEQKMSTCCEFHLSWFDATRIYFRIGRYKAIIKFLDKPLFFVVTYVLAGL